ncbi:hypothetical protein ACHAQJ_007168 [Trichoderma viride]
MANLMESSTIVALPSHCNFTSIQEFFDDATENGLNITTQIEDCPNLCILTFGTGNPDLSGIGVGGPLIALLELENHRVIMTEHAVLRGLDILDNSLPSGDVFGLRKLFEDSIDVQTIFWESNGFLILASAVATFPSVPLGLCSGHCRFIPKPTIRAFGDGLATGKLRLPEPTSFSQNHTCAISQGRGVRDRRPVRLVILCADHHHCVPSHPATGELTEDLDYYGGCVGAADYAFC